jgi:rod shape-determining protein MreB
MSLLQKRIGIDLGTVNTLIYVNGKIALNEPSVVAIDERNGEVLAVGAEAYRMVGRTPGNIVAVHPLRDGVIADFDATEKMIAHFIRKVARRKLLKPNLVVGVPYAATAVEKRAVIDAVQNAGAKEVFLIEEPVAAAIGAGLPIWEPTGHMVVDIGGGTADVVVLSLGGIVVGTSVKVAGNKIDEVIRHYIRKKHGLIIGDRTAEDLKKKIGTVGDDGGKATVCGQNLLTGLPTSVDVTSEELVGPIMDTASEVISAIRSTLERTPPELASDILDRGIVLTGGGSLLKGLSHLIEKETGLSISLVEQPLDCVAKGTGVIMDSLTRYKPFLSNQRKVA